MTVTYLAAQNAAFQVAFLVAALGVPTVGWVLLIVGLKQRSRGRPRPGAGLTDNPPPDAPSGTRLVVIGAVFMALGVLVIVWRLVTTGPEPSRGSGSAEFNSRTELLLVAAPSSR